MSDDFDGDSGESEVPDDLTDDMEEKIRQEVDDRVGDFYEMLEGDAETAARELELTLTSKALGKAGRLPLAGVPHHAIDGYVARLVRKGYHVAICDQTEEARPGKLVERAVTQILSPGTHFDERMLAAERNNFLAAVRSRRPQDLAAPPEIGASTYCKPMASRRASKATDQFGSTVEHITNTLPGFMLPTMSAVISLGAGLPGMSAVVMMMSTSRACLAYISRWAF